jgi:UDP-3-O-[3-hydroxymyristoyl] glucosamine N-acyltransferase
MHAHFSFMILTSVFCVQLQHFHPIPFTGAKVEDGAQINEAIICDKAVVKRNAKIGRGCVVSYGAVVGENVVLADYTRISRLKSLAVSDYVTLGTTLLYSSTFCQLQSPVVST